MQPVVGFDLDMTLVDSADGIAATLQATLAEQHASVSAEALWAYNGVPMEDILAALAPQLDPVRTTARYRELYPTLGVPLTRLLPGAAEAVAAVHDAGGRVLIVSTKVRRAVEAVLDQVDLVVDEVAGGLFAEDKGHYLRRAGAQVYVGDHPGDVRAAQVAGAVSVAVATGPHTAAELAAAGADVVLVDLLGFPHWLDDRGITRPTREGLPG